MSTGPGAAHGLLLAAGAGTRMGRPKALVHDPDGTSWLRRGLALLHEAGCREVTVVLGARAEEARALVPPGAAVVVAEDWHDGLAASLRAGLRALAARESGDGAGADTAVVTLVDLPDLTPEVVRRVRAAAPGPDDLARAVFKGRPGHPVVLGRAHWAPVVAASTGDTGAKHYLAAHGCVAVECGDLASGHDVDRPDGLGGRSPNR